MRSGPDFLSRDGAAPNQLIFQAEIVAIREAAGMKRKVKRREFNVIIERDTDGYFVATVPDLKGCHSQAKSLDLLMKRIREAIELCLEVEGDSLGSSEFIGVQRVGI